MTNMLARLTLIAMLAGAMFGSIARAAETAENHAAETTGDAQKGAEAEAAGQESAAAAEEKPETHDGANSADGHEEEGKGDEEKPKSLKLWPDTPAVENQRQPYVVIRTLRSVQDQVAQGSPAAHEFLKNFTRDSSIQFLALPAAVWQDVRNVRAAAYLVLSGGDPRVARVVSDYGGMPEHLDRRILRGALAFGEGRSTDARSLLEKVDARSLDPALGGMVSLIQGTLFAKVDPKRAISHFDDARLLAPGTLVEESALRQEILLLAKEGDTERFDVLSNQYSRRFSKSLFASTFRRQFIAGFARHAYKGISEWVSRTEAELQKIPESERLGMYIAIAEEATKSGHFEVGEYATSNALKLAQPGTRELSRANLYQGAILVATDKYDDGLSRLAAVDEAQLGASDREIYEAALLVSRRVRQWPALPQENPDPLPQSVTRAQQLISQADTLLGGGAQ